jgi:DNA-binding NarL/FixJ family response regulator
MKHPISIIVAEDQAILRKTLVTCLNNFVDLEVVAEASNGKQLLEHLKLCTPDIILLDLNMPVMNGWETLDVIQMRFPNSKVIILSANDSIETISKISNKGAAGFVSKCDDVEDLVLAIRDVYYVGKYYSDSVAHALANYSKDNEEQAETSETLSEREAEIVKEVCNGLSNKLISKKLFISSSTVDFHKQRIYKKTNCRNVLDLFKFALRNKMITIE